MPAGKEETSESACTMKIYFVRHAAKEKGDFFNIVLRHQDEPISTFGKKQSKKLHRYFKNKKISSIYVSSYIRTHQTIEFIAKRLHINPIIDARLNEIDLGELEALGDKEVEEKYPEFWRAYTQRNRDFRFPGGETGEEARKRVVDFITEKRKREENVLAVSHDGLMRVLLCFVVGLPVFKRFYFHVETCGIIEIEYTDTVGEWRLIKFNQTVV